MPRGRPATPTKIKELSGNPGKRALNKSEPIPTGAPVAPKWLGKEAQIIWRRLATSMPAGVYTVADEPIMVALVEAIALHKEATIYLQTHPKVVPGSTGQDVISPWVKIQADALRQIASLTPRLGLDPVARQSLHIEKEQEEASKFDFH